MEAQTTHRRAGGHSSSSNSIATHLANQNQVLKWLQDFSDKVEERAKGAAAEVNGLLKEAEALELEVKTAVVSFDNLTRRRFIEHKISDEDSLHSKMRDSMQGSLQSQVPAQDYERDILPRYIEALHTGLNSCYVHIWSSSTYYWFQEYNHDNSCSLADDVQPLTDDFSWLWEFQGESLGSGAADLLESQMLGVQRGFEKSIKSCFFGNTGETDSLVSAAREFKAMLEAALVNPYKLYDASVENTNTSEVHHNTDPVMLTGTGEAAHERSTEDNSEEAGLLASLQDPCTNAHDLYSAFVREGLFDTGDEILSMDAMESAGTSISVPTSGLANPATAGSAERTFSINEKLPNEENLTETSNNHEEDGHKDAHAASPPEQKDGVSGSS